MQATHLQSAKLLADPRSAKARKTLQQLASSERIVQLCNIEAMEQVHIWKSTFRPDFLVAYAMADTSPGKNSRLMAARFAASAAGTLSASPAR